MNFGIGLLLLSLAALLVYLGRPDKDLNSPRFLQFNAALVLYPPVILVVLAFGATELNSCAVGASPLNRHPHGAKAASQSGKA